MPLNREKPGSIEKAIVLFGKVIIDSFFLLLVLLGLVQILLGMAFILGVAFYGFVTLVGPSLPCASICANWAKWFQALGIGTMPLPSLMAPILTSASAVIAIGIFLFTRLIARNVESGKTLQWCNENFFKARKDFLEESAVGCTDVSRKAKQEAAAVALASLYHIELHLYLRGLIPTDILALWTRSLILDCWKWKFEEAARQALLIAQIKTLGDRYFDEFENEILKKGAGKLEDFKTEDEDRVRAVLDGYLGDIKGTCRAIRSRWQDRRYNMKLFGRVSLGFCVPLDRISGALMAHLIRKIDFDDHYRWS